MDLKAACFSVCPTVAANQLIIHRKSEMAENISENQVNTLEEGDHLFISLSGSVFQH